MKIGIIGDGQVGSTTAYTLAREGIARDIVLIDINTSKAEADALDLIHSTVFKHDCNVIAGDYRDLDGAGFVIITADGAPLFNASRLELVGGNTKMFKDMIPQIAEYAPDAIIIVTTNPVDIMTYVALQLSGFPASHVIGSGTVLDTARFKSILSEAIGITPRSVHAYVMGEHGDSALISWATARVGALGVEDFAAQIGRPLDTDRKRSVSTEVVQVPYKIFHGKKATSYGIASSLAAICQAIVFDEKKVLTVSSFHRDVAGIKNVCLSLPSIIGRHGVEQTTMPPLPEIENAKLRQSAEVIAEVQKKAMELLG